jgi:cytochrome c-type biogenesis protein CcmH
MHAFTRWTLAWSLALLASFALAGASVWAQQPEPSDDEVNAVARQLYCPVCENVPLDVCPTKACEQWRATIREKLAAGWTEKEIKDYFVQQYGDRVLATPPPGGLNWLVYVLPPAAFLAGAAVLVRAFQRWRTEASEGEGQAAVVIEAEEDPYVARLEEELRRRA